MVKKSVAIKVHPKFFNIFERERKKLEIKNGVRFSQSKFTEYLAKGNIKLQSQKIDKKFSPKKPKNSKINKHKSYGSFII